MLCTENSKQREMLQTRKNLSIGERVALKGKFVFSTQEVLEAACDAERAIPDKTSQKQRCTQAAVAEIKEQEVELFKNVSNSLDSNCIVIQLRSLS